MAFSQRIKQLLNTKILDVILLLMEFHQRVLYLEQFHIEERERGMFLSLDRSYAAEERQFEKSGT